MRLLTVLSLSAAAFAQHASFSSGFGRTPFDQHTKFSVDALSLGISAASESTKTGPNRTRHDALPVDKVYGLNIGNWLLMEPWMSLEEWEAMGGEHCNDCSTCRRSEWSLANYLGQAETNRVFQQHWKTWFTKQDVANIKSYGMNVVRVPLGFWIIEAIVNRAEEPYAQGGLDELIRGLRDMKEAGLHVILDHHALPGVSSKGQMFAGNCTPTIHFYEDYNYQRAATWAAAMTFLSHVHPDFESVFAIQAINEPEMNYALTPGYDRYQKSFVLTVRAVELALGIFCDSRIVFESLNDPITRGALRDAVPIIFDLAKKYNLKIPFGRNDSPFIAESGASRPGSLGGVMGKNKRKCLSTNFMNRDWQWSADPNVKVPNPADVARGPQVYDNHLYFNFGGVADHTPLAYMTTLCNLMRTEDAAAIGNAPMFFGEWAISTGFPNGTTDEFLRQWGDAQKLIYGKSAGWIFWNYKVINNVETRMWSYKDAVANGLMTAKAQDFFDANVCDPYKKPQP